MRPHPCSVGKDFGFFYCVHNIQGRRLSFDSPAIVKRVKVPQQDIAISLMEQNEKCPAGMT